MRKVTIKRIERLEGIECKDCKRGIRLDDNFVFCTLKVRVNYSNQSCSKAEKGECEVAIEDLEKIIDIYIANKDMIEMLNSQNDAIKKLLVSKIGDGSADIGKYNVEIVKMKKNILDTEKVREYLKAQRLLDEFTRNIEVIYPRIKRL
jgi:nitrate/TMAO reductase-like tetraheme cytochrome c subunit